MPPPPPKLQFRNKTAQEETNASTILSEVLDKTITTMDRTVFDYLVLVASVKKPQ